MTIRWEARSHAQIYEEVHTPTGDLASTVAGWRWSAADLGELRSRYERAVEQLMAVSEGASAEAAARASRRATRGLAEARELAAQAGAQRARLTELNDELRRGLLPPVPPTETMSNFTGAGIAWLTAPDFTAADAHRLNEEELARDRMRAYEQTLDPDTLAGESTPTPTSPSDDHPTVPLIPRPQFPPEFTPPPSGPATETWVVSGQLDAPPPDSAPSGHIEPPARVLGSDPTVPVIAKPVAPVVGRFEGPAPAFGPTGHVMPVSGQFDGKAPAFGPTGHVEQPAEPAPPAPIPGSALPPREWVDPQAIRRNPDDPFQPGFQVSPAVWGDS
jgi:hypothetical protein